MSPNYVRVIPLRERDRRRPQARRTSPQSATALRSRPPSLRERAVSMARERGAVTTKELQAAGVLRCYLRPMCEEGLLTPGRSRPLRPGRADRAAEAGREDWHGMGRVDSSCAKNAHVRSRSLSPSFLRSEAKRNALGVRNPRPASNLAACARAQPWLPLFGRSATQGDAGGCLLAEGVDQVWRAGRFGVAPLRLAIRRLS